MSRDDPDAVAGERGSSLVRQVTSLHSRLSNLLALGLMVAMGAAVLTAYYVHAAQRQAQLRQKAQSATSSRAQSEMPLPALEPVVSPAPIAREAVPSNAAPLGQSLSLDPAPQTGAVSAPSAATAAGSNETPRPSNLERRLSGSAYARGSENYSRAESTTGPTNSGVAGGGPSAAALAPAAGAVLPRTEFGSTTRARVLSTQRLLLPKGAFIDCTLETAIDSTLPGMTTCVTATDTFGVDGQVVLLDRGTKVVGETRGQVQQGTARVFVIWTEARTPTGVIVPLDSPGADELGRSGLPGSVDRHFWERFGAALFISTIDGAEQAAVQSASRGSGTIIYNPSATTDVATEVLKSTLSIAPTVRKDNGDRIQILVARDIDFTPVYELRRGGVER
jgi:type IV secretion system protein VirB10